MNAKDDLQSRWWKLEEKFMDKFGKKPDVEDILFLIGIQEIGNFKKKIFEGAKAGPDARSRMFAAVAKWLL